MLNYMNAEFFRILKKRKLYFIVLICLYFLMQLLNSWTKNFVFPDNSSIIYNMATASLELLPLISYWVFMSVYMDDISMKTLNNTVAGGILKQQIPIVKFIVATIFLFIVLIIFIIAFFLIHTIFPFGPINLSQQQYTFIFYNTIFCYFSAIVYFAMSSVFVYAFQKNIPALITYLFLSLSGIYISIRFGEQLFRINLSMLKHVVFDEHKKTAIGNFNVILKNIEAFNVSSQFTFYFICVIYICISLILASYICSKKDITS